MKRKATSPARAKAARAGQHNWDWHLRALQSLRDRLTRGRDRQREETSEPLVQDTNDLADCATDEFDHDLAFSLLSQEETALHEVDAALARLNAGTYGICEETGKPIPAARLRAVPWTRYCKEAQEQFEREGAVKVPRLAPLADVHGLIERAEVPPDSGRPQRKRRKSERRAR